MSTMKYLDGQKRVTICQYGFYTGLPIHTLKYQCSKFIKGVDRSCLQQKIFIHRFAVNGQKVYSM